jgi:hypothetical protein
MSAIVVSNSYTSTLAGLAGTPACSQIAAVIAASASPLTWGTEKWPVSRFRTSGCG